MSKTDVIAGAPLHNFEITEDGVKIDGKNIVASNVGFNWDASEALPTVDVKCYCDSISTKIDAELSLDIETYTDREMVEFGEMVRRNTVREYPTSDIEFAEMGLKIVAKFVEMFKAK